MSFRTLRRLYTGKMRELMLLRVLRQRSKPTLCELLPRRLLRRRPDSVLLVKVPLRSVDRQPSHKEVRGPVSPRVVPGRIREYLLDAVSVRAVRRPDIAKVRFQMSKQPVQRRLRRPLRAGLFRRAFRRRLAIHAKNVRLDLPEQLFRRFRLQKMRENLSFWQVRRPAIRALRVELPRRTVRRL